MRLIVTNELTVTEFASIAGTDLHASMIKNNLKLITEANEDIFEIKSAVTQMSRSLWSSAGTNVGTYAFYFLDEMDKIAAIDFVNQKKAQSAGK